MTNLSHDDFKIKLNTIVNIGLKTERDWRQQCYPPNFGQFFVLAKVEALTRQKKNPSKDFFSFVRNGPVLSCTLVQGQWCFIAQ